MAMTVTPPPPPPAAPPGAPAAGRPARRHAGRVALLGLMLGVGVYSTARMPVKGDDAVPWDDAVIGVAGLWILAVLVVWGITRMRGCRTALWRVATAPALTATLLGLWIVVACGAVASRIT